MVTPIIAVAELASIVGPDRMPTLDEWLMVARDYRLSLFELERVAYVLHPEWKPTLDLGQEDRPALSS